MGGKKNDTVLVIGVDQSTGKANWATVMAWTTAKIFEVKLRDAIMDLPEVTPEATMKALRTNVETYYRRKPMADFEYLSSSITPSGTEFAVAIFIGLLISIGLAILFQKKDIFGDDGTRYKYGSSTRPKYSWEYPYGSKESLDVSLAECEQQLRGGFFRRLLSKRRR